MGDGTGDRVVEERHQLPRALRKLLRQQRHARPGARGARQHRLHGAIEGERPVHRPLARGLVPRLFHQPQQLFHALGGGGLQKEALAGQVLRAIESLQRTLAEQGGAHGLRRGAHAGEQRLVVEEAGRVGSAQAERRLQHQADLDDVAVERIAGPADEAIGVAQEGK